MPYCVQCGTRVEDRDQFCGSCGAPQEKRGGPGQAPPPPPPQHDLFSAISDRNAAVLCYVPLIGWIASIIVLASERFRRDHRLRFHAFQGLYLFAAWLLVDWVISPALLAPGFAFGFPFYRTAARLLKLVVLGAWVFMMIRVSQDQDYHLPIVGELAERSVSEQRL